MIRLTGLVDLKPLKEYYADEPVNHVDNIDNGPDDHMDGDMVKAKILQMSKQINALFNTISNQDSMNDWCQENLTTAANAISKVYDFVQYENTKVPTIGSGEGYPADGNSDRSNNNRA